jgi:nitrite reductase/ring-hydroxylating ferredoxin subunit
VETTTQNPDTGKSEEAGAASGLYDRGARFAPQGVGGYDENWYPVCLSTEISDGGVKGFDFLNGRVVVYRAEGGGPAQVLSPFCRHLGVDLSVGSVVGEELRCPFHHWRYNRRGECVATAIGDQPPARAKLFRFPTVESFGLVWAYNGLEPAYPAPSFGPEDEFTFKTIRSVEVPMDPFMLYSNTLDLQHLRVVHGMIFHKIPDRFPIDGRTITYEQEMTIPGLGDTRQKVKLWGTNCITLNSEIMGRDTYMMSAGLAVRGPLTRTFNVTAVRKVEGRAAEEQMVTSHLAMVEAFGLQLNREDDPIMRTVSPRLDNLTAADRAIAIYFKFVREYPRNAAASDMIRNDYIETAKPPGLPPQRLSPIAFEDEA